MLGLLRVRGHPAALGLLVLATLFQAMGPTPALATADQAVSISPVSPMGPDLGRVAAFNTGTSVFQVSPSSGTITRLSGTAARIDTGPALTPNITINCGTDGHCNNGTVQVVVRAVPSGSGRAVMSAVAAANISVNGMTLVSNVVSAGQTTLTFRTTRKLSTAGFSLGSTVQIGPGTPGTYTYNYVITATVTS